MQIAFSMRHETSEISTNTYIVRQRTSRHTCKRKTQLLRNPTSSSIRTEQEPSPNGILMTCDLIHNSRQDSPRMLTTLLFFKLNELCIPSHHPPMRSSPLDKYRLQQTLRQINIATRTSRLKITSPTPMEPPTRDPCILVASHSLAPPVILDQVAAIAESDALIVHAGVEIAQAFERSTIGYVRARFGGRP